MPEYLAPGVYVEETSFRAKSIEGVSTSTTAFAGITRKGPFFAEASDDGGERREEMPELLTSFADFERIYGGIVDLPTGTNYLAHAVRAFFDNGGGRLFVSRVVAKALRDDPTLGRSAREVRAGGADAGVRWLARFPGTAGNVTVTVTPRLTPATRATLDRSRPGAMIRTGGPAPEEKARLIGGPARPVALTEGARLLLTVGNQDVDLTVHGRPAEAVAADPLADPVDIPADFALEVVINDQPQRIALPEDSFTPAELVQLLNEQIVEGFARLTPNGELAIASDRRGTRSSVTVRQSPVLGFAQDVSAVSAADPNTNNVGDLRAVTADDVNGLLQAANVPAAVVPTTDGKLALISDQGGPTALVKVRADPNNQAVAFGFAADAEARGAGGGTSSYWVKCTDCRWIGAANSVLDPTTVPEKPTNTDRAYVLSLSVGVTDAEANTVQYEDLSLDRTSPRFIGDVLAAVPARRRDALENPVALVVGTNVDALTLRSALLPSGDQETRWLLANGDDRLGDVNADDYGEGLRAFESNEDVSIIAAPDAAAHPDESVRRAVNDRLITHVSRRRAYRIAVLDTPRDQTPTQALEVRSRMDSDRAALYYPWVVVANPLARPGDETTPAELTLPPSGFICGIYARTDVQRGVWKAPANEVVLGALRFESNINFAQQELLNPAGVNCLRFFPGRGYRVWGARTAGSDPEWKYVNIRRYFNYLERSIDHGTQWVVFEPNGERLWANVTETVSSFLYNEWVSGALLGTSPKEAFFVRCDRSTMTQNDLDNGRLICLIGVAAVKPAEFVIFRIGQKTADSRS